MARVVCTLPNASRLVISDLGPVRFASLGDGGGMLSEDIADHIVANLLRVPGYALYEMPSTAQHYAKADAKADKADSKLRAVPATQQKESA